MRAITTLALPLGIALAVDVGATEVAASAPKASRSSQSKPLNKINGLAIEELDDGTTVLKFKGTSEATFNVTRLSNPERLVVDIAGSQRGTVVPHAPVDSWAVGSVEVESVTEQGSKITRVVVSLKRDSSYIVVPKGRQLAVTVTPREVAPEAYFAAKGAGQRKADIRAMESKAQREAVAAGARARAAEDRAKAARVKEQSARSGAAAARSEASKVRSEAEAMLSQAEKAMARATEERDQAREARADAEKVLRDAKKAKKAGKKKAELDRAVAQAKAAEKAAKERQAKAETQLTTLKSDRRALERLLDGQKKKSTGLDQSIATKEHELAALERQVVDARAKYEAVGGAASAKTIADAKAKAAQTKARHAAMSKEVERLYAKVLAAKTESSKATADLANLKGHRRPSKSKLAKAKARAEKARSALTAASRDYKSRKSALRGMDAELADRHDELARLEQQQRMLANKGDALKAENQQARKALEAREAQLASVEGSVAKETKRLQSLQAELAEAQARLDKTIQTSKAGVRTEWESERKAAGATKVRDVRFEDTPTESRIIIDVEGPVVYAGSNITPSMRMLRLEGAGMPQALERSLDTRSFDAPVDMITSFREGSDVKIIVAAAPGVAGHDPVLEEKPGQLVWRFPRSKRGERSEVVSMGSKVGGFVKPPTTSARSSGKRGKWRGERIDIELQDAPIKDVLLLFSDIGRVNIIAGRDVGGKVTMKLNSVPWDQALDIILRSLQLGMVQEGNVIRVATSEDLDKERTKAIEEANARVQLKPLETRLVPLSYATVDEMVPKVQSVLSPRGTVTPDTRTNTLIIMDVAENIALAQQLVSQLDSQTPQVLIEARIVEARTSWLRQLGIQWGFDYIASAGTGNPTGIAFPNAIGVGGGSGDQQTDVRGLILPASAANPNYAVDLPAPVGGGAGGAIGFSFGSISGNLNTNLRLSAAEDMGEVRIISAPKIVTLDNSQAQIEQGVQIPISQVSAAGVNTRYVNATLALRVTPHVTNEGSVLLDVQVQKNEADFVNTGARGDPTILTKQATSQMLITDGDTAVIGGIYTRNQSINRKKVPWLADIPIIGWFFKNKTEADTRTEVLIFLTPKIINRSVSIGE
jgi:type IV pilus assembly protein PilQ